MVKAASHIGGISNEPSVISPLHLLQQRLDVCQKLEGESVIFLLHLVGRPIPEMPGERRAPVGLSGGSQAWGASHWCQGWRASELDVPFAMRP